ncbi:auxilin-like clathrin-binding protein required for normal clathrin function [Linderina pennispora]|nr:auxilin-like clathrin-binding protein required for normal clathrin function [Linderina pennispora]
MTTAARPTFDPARGKETVVITYQQHKTDLASHTKLKYRQPGQSNEDEYTIEDLKEELREAERRHFESRGIKNGAHAPDDPQEKLRFIEMAQRLDAESSDDEADDSNDGGSSADESSDSDSEDETAMLMRELEKIKRERAEEKAREEQEALEEQAEKVSALGDNPLLGKKDFSVKRRWDDDVVFRNQARGDDDKPKKRFINDMLRSDFHRKFMKNKFQMDDFRGLNWQSRSGGSTTPSHSAGRASPMSKQTQSKDDPFGELVSFTSTAKPSDRSKLTLREQLEQKSRNSPSASPKPSQTSAADSLWNFDALERASTPRSVSHTPVPQSTAMDFDPFASPSQPAPKQPMAAPAPRPNAAATAPVLLDDDEPIPMDINPPPAASQPAGVDRDFEIAQIVEHGFSADQARSALELSGGSTRKAIQLLREQKSAERQMHQQPSQRFHDESSDDDGTGYSYNRQPRQPRDMFAGGPETLVAAANEIGASVWKQANSLFAFGKKKITEMQESLQDQRRRENTDELWKSGWPSNNPNMQRYRDDSSDEEEVYVSSRRRGGQPARRAEPEPPRRAEPQLARSVGRTQQETSAFIDFGDVLESRPAAPQRRAQPPPVSAARTAPTQPPRPPQQRQPPSAPRSVQSTPVPQLAANILRESRTIKSSANDKFKLGQFGDAIAGYSLAIRRVSQHTADHPILIVLYNNRALAYARNGEAKQSLADCTASLELYEKYRAHGSIALDSTETIGLEEQRSKTLQRRGEANEAAERYQDAYADWKLLREIARDPSSRQQAVRGIQRCEKALGIAQPVKKPVKKPEPRAEDLANVFASISMSHVKSTGGPATASIENSAAVGEMRRQERAKQEEDAQRLAINDEVDAMLAQWRDGKRQNIRALLSSLHTLLLTFKPIGMHEILEPNKVKRAYMRAIARLHPDKLDKDLDVKTKMISANVFSTLNEAWDAFKTQEGIS